MGSDNLTLIASHPQFKKYALWLLIDETELTAAEAAEPEEFDQAISQLTDVELEQLTLYMEFLLSRRQ